MAARPPDARRPPGEHRLRVPLDLLGAQPVGRADAVGGGDRGDDRDLGTEEDVDETRGAADLLEEVAHRGRREQLVDAARERTEDRPEQHERDRPREEHAALQPPGQARRRAEAPGRRSWPVLAQAGTEVATGAHRDGCGPERHGGEQRQHQDPPAVAGVGTQLLVPADGGQPREDPGARLGEVADRAQRVGDGDDDEAGTARGAGARRQLRSDDSDRAVDEPGRAPAEPERQRSLPGQARCGVRGRGEQCQGDAGPPDEDEGRGHRCEPAEPAAAQQLEAPWLLLATGVADRDEEHHDPDDRRPQGGELDHRHRAQRGRVVDAAVEGDDGGRRVDRLRRGDARLLGRVEVDGRGRRGAGGHSQADHPRGEQDPVTTQREPQRRSVAGVRLTHGRRRRRSRRRSARGRAARGSGGGSRGS